MRDFDFKRLLHNAIGYEVISRGFEVAKGYKPDVVLRRKDEYIIMECDTGTTRKGYVGAMVKAAKYLSGEKNGIAVFVLKEKKNTTVEQISSHLQPYFDWIKPLTNLETVYVISVDLYCSVDTPLQLLDPVFMRHAKTVTKQLK